MLQPVRCEHFAEKLVAWFKRQCPTEATVHLQAHQGNWEREYPVTIRDNGTISFDYREVPLGYYDFRVYYLGFPIDQKTILITE